MNKLKIKFTPEEKKKLRKAKIKLNTLENYSFNEILSAVNGDAERTAEIRLQLFKWVGGPEHKYLNNNLNSIMRATSPLKGMEALMASVSQINRITDSVRNFDMIRGKSSMLGNDITRMMEIQNVNRIAGIDKLRVSTGLGFVGDNQENIQRMIVGSQFIGGGISKFMESISLAKTSGMDRIHSTLGTGLFEELTKNHRTFEITKGISSLLSSLPNASELAMGSRLSNGVPHSILREAEFKKLGISSLIGEMNTSSIFEKAHLTGISSAMAQAALISRLAESNLGSFEWSRIGSRMALSAAEINSTQKNFLNLTAQYSDVLKIINTKPNWIYDAPEVAKMPAVDFYSTSRLLKIVTSQDEESAEIRKTDIIINEENTDAIVRFLLN